MRYKNKKLTVALVLTMLCGILSPLFNHHTLATDGEKTNTSIPELYSHGSQKRNGLQNKFA